MGYSSFPKSFIHPYRLGTFSRSTIQELLLRSTNTARVPELLIFNVITRIAASTYDHQCSLSKKDSWATSDTMLSNGGRRGSRGLPVPSTRTRCKELLYPLYYTVTLCQKMINAITSIFCNNSLVSSQ